MYEKEETKKANKEYNVKSLITVWLLIQLLFIIFKVAGVIGWRLIWVLAITWAPFSFLLSIAFIVGVVIGSKEAIEAYKKKQEKDKRIFHRERRYRN